MNTLHFVQNHLSLNTWGTVALNIKSYPDLFSSLAILALNTVNVAAKVFKKIPPFVGHGAQTWLASMGVIGLYQYNWVYLVKSCKDFILAFKESDFSSMFLTSLKVCVNGIDILLCCGSFSAAVAALMGFPIIAKTIYLAMRSYGVFSLISWIGLQISDYRQNEQILATMGQIANSDNRFKHVFQQFSAIVLGHASPSESLKERAFTLKLIRQLEPSFIEISRKKCRDYILALDKRDEESFSKEFFLDLKKDIGLNHDYTKGNMELVVFNYCCLGAGKVYPGTLLQSILQWVSSLLWTGKLACMKYDVVEKKVRTGQIHVFNH